MHNLYIEGKDGSWEIAQLWLVRELQYALLVMIDKDYWKIKILISTKIKDKLKTGLKIHDILKDAWNPASFNTEISMSVKRNIVSFILSIMPDKECKANVNSWLYIETYPFIYNVKTTELGYFLIQECSMLTIFRFAPVFLWRCNCKPRISSPNRQMKWLVVILSSL